MLSTPPPQLLAAVSACLSTVRFVLVDCFFGETRYIGCARLTRVWAGRCCLPGYLRGGLLFFLSFLREFCPGRGYVPGYKSGGLLFFLLVSFCKTCVPLATPLEFQATHSPKGKFSMSNKGAFTP